MKAHVKEFVMKALLTVFVLPVCVLSLLGTVACSSSPTSPSSSQPSIDTNVTQRVNVVPSASLATADGVTLTFAGYLGNERVYRGADGNYYQADQWAGPGVPASYARIVGFNVSDITPTNNTGTLDRGL
jgi:hypothetical protein